MSVIDCTPRPEGSMSRTLAEALARMVCESLPAGHPFQNLGVTAKAEVVRAAVFYASLRG